ncbi:MAG: hypothetical protein L6V80_01510 [Bacteroidales bacterium]|nr:MAG: hypothetical protein L6V80_01510 [Bacteroidales bacterium]
MTKQKISNAMKLKHQQRSESEKNGKQPRNKVKAMKKIIGEEYRGWMILSRYVRRRLTKMSICAN